MMQSSLFPVRLVQEDAASGTRDLRWIGTDAAGVRYALRAVDDPRPFSPLTEWVCYRLCQHCGIYQPGFNIVERLDGSLAFGSEWVESDVWQIDPVAQTALQIEAWLREAADDLSAMFALDAFLPNADRHARNFLLRRMGGRVRAMAFDWSDVTLLSDAWPWAPRSNSAQMFQYLVRLGIWRQAPAKAVLQRLQALTAQGFVSILDASPDEWRHDFDLASAAQWWRDRLSSRLANTGALLSLQP